VSDKCVYVQCVIVLLLVKYCMHVCMWMIHRHLTQNYMYMCVQLTKTIKRCCASNSLFVECLLILLSVCSLLISLWQQKHKSQIYDRTLGLLSCLKHTALHRLRVRMNVILSISVSTWRPSRSLHVHTPPPFQTKLEKDGCK